MRAARPRVGNANERPAVFVLPGILGSHLKVDGQRIWLSLRFLNNLGKLKWDQDPKALGLVRPDGPVGMTYDDLVDRLADTHDVIRFGFDWRRPLEDEARRLADEIDDALASRVVTQRPVRIVAHSMGGLLVRTLRLERPETWKRMLDREGARVLMLGAPNDGSWAPMQVLSGDDTFGNMLTAFGSLFDNQGTRQTIAEMPGLMQLQAGLLDPSLGLDKEAGWSRLAQADLDVVNARIANGTWWHKDPLQRDLHKWGAPTQAALDRAVALRKRLDEQRDLGPDASKVLMVVGEAPTTAGGSPDDRERRRLCGRRGGRPCHPRKRASVRRRGLESRRGPRQSRQREGRLRRLCRTPDPRGHHTARTPHGRGRDRARDARGRRHFRRDPERPSRTARGAEPPAAQQDVFAVVGDVGPAPERARGAPRLRISVVNGNLRFVREPLLLGHYQSLKLTAGSEAEIDRLIGQVMSASLRAGLYPVAPGSNQVFVNLSTGDDPYAIPRPAAVIVAGLGEEGTLRATDLVSTVRQATLAYAQRLLEAGAPAAFDLAATLIGSGGIGVQVETAAQAIAEGVGQANQRLEQVKWPVVANLQLIELYLDRATEAHYALAALAADYPLKYELAPQVELGAGGLPRPLNPGYRGARYDFISVERLRGDYRGIGATLEFTLDTNRARNEVRSKPTQTKLVDELVKVAASNANRNEKIGRSLFKLLTPLEVQRFLSGSSSVLLQLDEKTAAYPWELLDTQPDDQRDDSRRWAVRTRMLRKLRTTDFRERPLDARREDGALVIGEPKTDPDRYPPLPGARDEAAAVGEILGVTPLLNPDALEVVNAVLDARVRILHIAGHGDFLEDKTGGVVLSSGAVFGPREFGSMPAVPELAFINCCFLGQITPGSKQIASPLGDRRPRFASNVAAELIRNGRGGLGGGRRTGQAVREDFLSSAD